MGRHYTLPAISLVVFTRYQGLSHCTQADSATNNILSIWLDNNRQLSLPRTCCQMSHPGGFEPQTLLTKVQRLIHLATVTGKS